MLPLREKYDKIMLVMNYNSLEVNLKEFFNKYSFAMVKLFVYQCVIGIFGNVLALTFAKSAPLKIVVSIFSLLFYSFLCYMLVWEIGSKDNPAIEAKRMKYKPLSGLYMALGAAIPNLIIATIHAVSLPFANSNKLLSGICAISRIILLFIEGMFTGILSAIKLDGMALNNFWWTYFIISAPAVIVATLAYILGSKNIHFTKVLLPVTPEDMEIRRERKINKK